MNAELQKNIFEARLRDFVNSLQGYVSTGMTDNGV